MNRGIHAMPRQMPPWLMPVLAAVGAAAAACLCTWGVLTTLRRQVRPTAAPAERSSAVSAGLLLAPTLPPETTAEPTLPVTEPPETTAAETTVTTTTTRVRVTAPPVVVEPSGIKDDQVTRTAPPQAKPTGVTMDTVKQDFQGAGHRIGIDVSRHNLAIDWQRVKAAGVDFAMIRCGYRTTVGGEIFEDANFRTNIQGALDAGVEVGIYFFSAAKTVTEAREEAAFVAEVLKDYQKQITWPVAFDFEVFDYDRLAGVDYTTITDLCIAFLEDIADAGYTPMIYSSRNMLWNKLETARLAKYRVWMAQYVNTLDQKRYGADHAIWQCASDGRVDGISKRVDMNIAYEDLSQPHERFLPAIGPEDWPDTFEGFSFREVCEEVEVTEDKLGLRTSPNSELPNRWATGRQGQRLLRTGVDEEKGWSRLEIDGVTVYADHRYLRFLRETETTTAATTAASTAATDTTAAGTETETGTASTGMTAGTTGSADTAVPPSDLLTDSAGQN